MRAKARQETRTAPGQRRQDAQQNSHDGLGGLSRIGGLSRPGRQAFLTLQAELGHHFLQIFPDFAFCAPGSQQECGMVSRHPFSSPELEPMPSQMRSALGFPSPKTSLVRPRCNLQRVHSPMSPRILGSESPAILITESNKETTGTAGSESIFGAGCGAVRVNFTGSVFWTLFGKVIFSVMPPFRRGSQSR